VSGETEGNISGWTVDTLHAHLSMLREADQVFHAERDRRYAEVSEARAEALKIKEQADRDALGLAREIQTYKDEKANELRSQIERERGTYVTQSDLRGAVEKIEATVKPISEWIAAQTGVRTGAQEKVTDLRASIGIYILLATLALSIVVFFTRG
jgi:vacuolar-type H+-ATPase subunit H